MAAPTTKDAAKLVAASGVGAEPARVAQAWQYLALRRRATWVGVVCALAAGFGPLDGEPGLSIFIPRLLAGYMFGVLLTELFARGSARGTVRAASLAPRRASDLVPGWSLVVPWVILVPLLATPLLAIGWHPHGATHTHDANGDCRASAYWPSTGTLFAIAGVAAVALVLHAVTLRRLARRPQPAEDPAALRLDRTLRARSARASLAAASALGLMLLNIVGQGVEEGIHSFVCGPPITTFGINGNVYSWAGAVAPWVQNVSLVFLLCAFPAWLVCQRLPLPKSPLDNR